MAQVKYKMWKASKYNFFMFPHVTLFFGLISPLTNYYPVRKECFCAATYMRCPHFPSDLSAKLPSGFPRGSFNSPESVRAAGYSAPPQVTGTEPAPPKYLLNRLFNMGEHTPTLENPSPSPGASASAMAACSTEQWKPSLVGFSIFLLPRYQISIQMKNQEMVR